MPFLTFREKFHLDVSIKAVPLPKHEVASDCSAVATQVPQLT